MTIPEAGLTKSMLASDSLRGNKPRERIDLRPQGCLHLIRSQCLAERRRDGAIPITVILNGPTSEVAAFFSTPNVEREKCEYQFSGHLFNPAWNRTPFYHSEAGALTIRPSDRMVIFSWKSARKNRNVRKIQFEYKIISKVK